LLPFGKYKWQWYQLSLLASTLIWVIIFNHKAESPTFVIAVCGVLIWYFNGLPRVGWHKVILWSVIVFTSLSVTDLFPPYVRSQVFIPYAVKAVPCIVVWVIIWIELLVTPSVENSKVNAVPAKA
jgi:hypothetical protein